MEKYKNKEDIVVSAVQIETIVADENNPDGSTVLNGSIKVDHQYILDMAPKVGDYFVEFEDGSRVKLTAEDFADEFTKVEEEEESK